VRNVRPSVASRRARSVAPSRSPAPRKYSVQGIAFRRGGGRREAARRGAPAQPAARRTRRLRRRHRRRRADVLSSASLRGAAPAAPNVQNGRLGALCAKSPQIGGLLGAPVGDLLRRQTGPKYPVLVLAETGSVHCFGLHNIGSPAQPVVYVLLCPFEDSKGLFIKVFVFDCCRAIHHQADLSIKQPNLTLYFAVRK